MLVQTWKFKNNIMQTKEKNFEQDIETYLLKILSPKVCKNYLCKDIFF